MLPDYYFDLGIPFSADLKTIKKAYRTKAVIAHPDRGGSHEAMLRINEAHEILSNPDTRRHYDEARANQYNQGAQQKATADSSQARQQAEQYPRQWSDFESWLAKDFMEAKYGQAGIWPTIENSNSGALLIIIGLAVGGFASYAFVDNARGVILGAAVGGFAGQWIHKQIGQSMRIPGAPPRPPAPSQNEYSPPLKAPKAEATAAHEKGVGLAVICAVIAFFVLIFVCKSTMGDGFFIEQESFTNWPGVFIGTGICTFIAYRVGRKL